ncbi:MAG: hypothetical protein PHV34_08910 [Verrucomicrobiae bacterium]|nr:hypothetical protein [Verrucomicrobiae bacterium]
MNLTQEQRIAKHKDFLKANWELIAAFAWEHYQQRGRGAVCVVEEDFVHSKHPAFAPIRFHYVVENSEELKAMGGWPGDKEQNWVRTYDPAVRVVVLVIRDNGGTSGYLAGGPKSPPEAFANRTAAGN